jgi:hypothetical protein
MRLQGRPGAHSMRVAGRISIIYALHRFSAAGCFARAFSGTSSEPSLCRHQTLRLSRNVQPTNVGLSARFCSDRQSGLCPRRAQVLIVSHAPPARGRCKFVHTSFCMWEVYSTHQSPVIFAAYSLQNSGISSFKGVFSTGISHFA